VPIAIRTTSGSCLATEGVKSTRNRSCYEHYPRWTFKDGAKGGGPLDLPGRRNRSHLETSGRKGRAGRSPGLTSAKEKPPGLKRRARDLYRRCERRARKCRRDSKLTATRLANLARPASPGNVKSRSRLRSAGPPVSSAHECTRQNRLRRLLPESGSDPADSSCSRRPFARAV